MKCRICGIKIDKGIFVHVKDGVNITIEGICVNCKNNEIKKKLDDKYNGGSY